MVATKFFVSSIKASLFVINHFFPEQGGQDSALTWYEYESLSRLSSLYQVNEWQPPNSSHAQEKFTELHRKKLEYGYDFNKIIQKKKAFRNPSIYEKLILHCGIDEFGNILNSPKMVTTDYLSPGTNFPAELYDGHLFGKESYYEELARAQKDEMDRHGL